jgi:hypothetical protein
MLEKFKYSQEVIATGVADIDLVVTNNAYTLSLNLGAGSGKYKTKEIVFQSPDSTLENATASATVQSFVPKSNILTVTNIAGEFVDNRTIIGEVSNAQYLLTTFDPLVDNSYSEVYDNKLINTNATAIIDFSETNPFGNI